jgi:hypothetical protein
MKICRIIVLRMRNVSNKSCIENQNTHFVSNNSFFENRAVFEIMSKNVVERETLQTTIWRLVAWCNIKATRAQKHACARAATHIHAHAHTHTEMRTFFPPATVVSWTRLSHLICTLLSCYRRDSVFAVRYELNMCYSNCGQRNCRYRL